MKRQVLLRVLLSFVLLFSQQMATAHALEHLTAVFDAAAQVEDDPSELAKAVAQHQNCHQCLAFAQLAGPLPANACSFAPLELARYAIDRAAPGPVCGTSPLAAQPRGPPRT